MGQVNYFIKATPSKTALGAARELGLIVKAQRFAIVEAYVGKEAQGAGKGLSMQTEWVKAGGRAMYSARVTQREDGILGVISKAVESASVTAQTCTPGTARARRVTLKGSRSGELKKIAVPITSNFEEWYTKPAVESVNWVVSPVVRIDRQKVDLSVPEPEYHVGKMLDRASRRKQYFVNTYSMSNTSYANM